MFNLHILNETFTNGFSYSAIMIISFLSILCGIFVIISKNPVVSVLFLIGLFLSIAGYLMMLGMNFIGLSYLLVYVGAVSILFLFILMLINVRVSELSTDSSNSVPLALQISVFFFYTLYSLISYNVQLEDIYNTNIGSKVDITSHSLNSSLYQLINMFNPKDISFVTSHVWDGALAESSHITSIGNILYTSYPLWLIITSLILLLSMVGAIIITIRQK